MIRRNDHAFQKLNLPCFTLAGTVSLLSHSSKEALRRRMRDMVNRGLLLLLKDGVFWIISHEQDTVEYLPNRHLVAGSLARDANYYRGYYSAFELHSLITQSSMMEQTVMDTQIKPAALAIGKEIQRTNHG